MTQEELMKDLEEREKDTLDTFTGAYTNDQGTGMIDKLGEVYADVGSALDAGQTMLENANKEQLDYTIDEIERQKAQAQKDYEKEQKAAFVDYQKQVDPYGVNAEKMVSAGLDNSGFAESSKVAMYNQYQQRVSVARESMQRSIAEYNASMTQARVSNSVAMAQLAYETLMKKMQYTTEHMLKRNDLLLSMTEGQVAIKQNATNNWLDTLGRLESGEIEGRSGLAIDTEVSEEEVFTGPGLLFGKNKMVTYNNVEEYLTNLGVPAEDVAKLMTRKAWRQGGKDRYTEYATYDEYLRAVVKHYGGF